MQTVVNSFSKYYSLISHSRSLCLDKLRVSYLTMNAQHFITARCYASAVLAMGLCLSVCLSVSVTSRSSTKTAKRIGSHKQHHTIAQGH